MSSKPNPLLCERCGIKSKSHGKKICDKCNFDLRIEVMKRETEQRKLKERFLPPQVRRTTMAEIVVDARIYAAAEKVRPSRNAPFEVSFLTTTGIRAVERYDKASNAQQRFDTLKTRFNAAGLRYWGVTSKKRIELGRHNGQNRIDLEAQEPR